MLGSLFDIQQIDQCEVFIAPKLLGGHASPSPLAGLGIEKVGEGPAMSLIQHQIRDQDMHLTYDCVGVVKQGSLNRQRSI